MSVISLIAKIDQMSKPNFLRIFKIFSEIHHIHAKFAIVVLLQTLICKIVNLCEKCLKKLEFAKYNSEKYILLHFRFITSLIS